MKADAPLPHGTNKIDLGSAILTFLDDKLVMAPKGSAEHITVHLGFHSKILDIHKTRRLKGNKDEHETLFALPHERLGSLAQSAGDEFLATFLSIFQPLRIGWLARNYIGVEPAFFPMGQECDHILSMKKKRLCVDEAKLLERMGKLEYLEDLFDLPNGHAFSLISYKKPAAPKIIGVGFKFDDPLVGPKLIWSSNKRLSRGFTALFQRLKSALTPQG